MDVSVTDTRKVSFPPTHGVFSLGCSFYLRIWILLLFSSSQTHWRIQGAPPAPPPPQQDQFLSFLHMFLPKSVRIGGWRPPPERVGAPPTGNPGSATAETY